ncbi:MAG: glutamine-hydrolyzing carbamoyl-phosphate synthase small subunit [Lachnospiraceae bacterium]|nr:glutamine-hydrolyzing carbamoyl-phosphate synthase small subunit [Lachnospiraceae bacterium]
MKKNIRKIVLEDGSVYTGIGFGCMENRKAEIVFNTSMAGYQEILSDPSYTDQAVVMTYPLIGNYGMCEEDYETSRPSMTAMIVREYCEIPSNFRCTKTLDEVMKEYGIVGIQGIDTRKLTRHIRTVGSCRAYLVDESYDTRKAVRELWNWVPGTDAVPRVSTKEIYEFSLDPTYDTLPGIREVTGIAETKKPHVVVIDCGIKHNILRQMAARGMRLTVVPWDTPAKTIEELRPDGIFISNGPGDPTYVQETIHTIRTLMGSCPIFGICLGHQIIALACGAQTYKLKFGHRGGNHPVKNLTTGRIEITSQNHSYAVLEESLKDTGLQVTHRNLLDQTIEGLADERKAVFSVQYHPESAPGPQDSAYLFDQFMEMMH